MNKMILLCVESDFHIFSALDKMKTYLLNNEDDEMNKLMVEEFIEQQSVDTMYASYSYDWITVDE